MVESLKNMNSSGEEINLREQYGCNKERVAEP